MILSTSYTTAEDCENQENGTPLNDGQPVHVCQYPRTPGTEMATCTETVECEAGQTPLWYRGKGGALTWEFEFDEQTTDACCQCQPITAIPTMTEWGVIALVLIFLAAGAVTIVRKRQTLMVR